MRGESLKTYQDFLQQGAGGDREAFILEAVREHRLSPEYAVAVDADAYDRQRNTTILRYQKLLYTMSGQAVPDNYSASYKLASSFFNRFVTQLSQYLLGSGISLDREENLRRLGREFDAQLQKAGRCALVDGVSFGFWNYNRLEVFRLTEFVPLYDEETGALEAGIRFWQLDRDRPLRCTLYEADGYADYIRTGDGPLVLLRPKRPYKQTVQADGAGGEAVSGEENYPVIPIVPLWGNPKHQSEQVGMKQCIDCYHLIKSGFANDIDDASMIYWTLENAGGMDDVSLAQFVERMKTVKAAVVDGDAGARAEAHTLEVPYESRVAYLDRLRRDLYEDAQIVDVYSLASGQRTATEINASYQPMDSKADQYEYCVRDFLAGIFAVAGIDDVPTFKRSRIANQKEQTQMVLMAADYLDSETVLRHLPWLDQDEVEGVLRRKAAEDARQALLQIQAESLDERELQERTEQLEQESRAAERQGSRLWQAQGGEPAQEERQRPYPERGSNGI